MEQPELVMNFLTVLGAPLSIVSQVLLVLYLPSFIQEPQIVSLN